MPEILDMFQRLKDTHKKNEELLRALNEAFSERYGGIVSQRVTNPYASIWKDGEIVGLVRLIPATESNGFVLAHRRQVGFVGNDNPVNPQTSDFEDVMEVLPDLLVKLEEVRDKAVGRITTDMERANRIQEALARATEAIEAMD